MILFKNVPKRKLIDCFLYKISCVFNPFYSKVDTNNYNNYKYLVVTLESFKWNQFHSKYIGSKFAI